MKDEENKNSIKSLSRLEHICKFPDPNGHENHHVGEAAMIRGPLDERVVKFLKTQIRSGCKKNKRATKTSVYICQQCYLCAWKKAESYWRKFRPNNKKNKNLITSVKNKTSYVSYTCEKNSSSKWFTESSNLCLLIIAVAICSMRTLFQSSLLYYHI